MMKPNRIGRCLEYWDIFCESLAAMLIKRKHGIGSAARTKRGRLPWTNVEFADSPSGEIDELSEIHRPAVGTLARTRLLLLAALRVWELKRGIRD
jgi:hypothetical protein